MNTIYILKAYTPVSDEELPGEEHYVVEHDDVKVSSEFIGVFDSVEVAEKTIKDLVANRKQHADWYSDWTNYCAFVLTEHELNVGLNDYGNPLGYESVRSYLGNGELNCFSDYDDRCKKPFVGRDDVSKYVKEGDYAFYLRGKKLVPILVDKLAFTKAQWKEQFAEGVAGDVTDDSGLAYIVDYGHDHPFSPYVFPLNILPCYEMSEDLKDKLQKEKIAYMNGEL